MVQYLHFRILEFPLILVVYEEIEYDRGRGSLVPTLCFTIFIGWIIFFTSNGIPHMSVVGTHLFAFDKMFISCGVKTPFQVQLCVKIMHVCYCMFADQSIICPSVKNVSPRKSWREQIQEPCTCYEIQPMVSVTISIQSIQQEPFQDPSISSPSASQVWMSLLTPALSG